MRAASAVFDAEGVEVDLHDSYIYVGVLIGGGQEELDYIKPKIAAWVEGIKAMRTVPGVGKLMGDLKI
eukprot:6807991-Ditylum_brightwellii.AAC.1